MTTPSRGWRQVDLADGTGKGNSPESDGPASNERKRDTPVDTWTWGEPKPDRKPE